MSVLAELRRGDISMLKRKNVQVSSDRPGNPCSQHQPNANNLYELLLDSLPHFAMIINRNRTVVAANRLAKEFGAKIGGYCWQDFGQCEFISEEDKKYINDYKEAPPEGTHCYFCLADEGLNVQKQACNPEVNAWGKI